MIVYRGGRRQRGYGIGGVFSSFFRKTSPFLKKGALTVGKNALSTLSNVLEDVEGGKNVVDSIKRRGKAGAWKTMREVGSQALKRSPELLADIFSSDSKRARREEHESDNEEEDIFS